MKSKFVTCQLYLLVAIFVSAAFISPSLLAQPATFSIPDSVVMKTFTLGAASWQIPVTNLTSSKREILVSFFGKDSSMFTFITPGFTLPFIYEFAGGIGSIDYINFSLYPTKDTGIFTDSLLLVDTATGYSHRVILITYVK